MRVVFLLLLTGLALAAPPREFSIVQTGKSVQQEWTWILHVRGRQICTETSPTVWDIRDYATGTHWVMDLRTKSYARYQMTPGGSPVDGISEKRVAGYKKVGPVLLKGVRCIYYESPGEKVWLNAQTRLVQQVKDGSNTIEMRDFKPGPQPNRYFVVPKGFKLSTHNQG